MFYRNITAVYKCCPFSHLFLTNGRPGVPQNAGSLGSFRPSEWICNNSFTIPPHFWKSFLAKTPLAAMQNATGKLLAVAWGFPWAVHWGTLVRKCCRTEQQCPTCISHPLLWPAWWGGQVYLSAGFGTLRKNFLISHHFWKVDVNGSKAFLGHQFKPGEGSQTIVDLQ